MSSLTVHQRKALNFEKHISLTANAGSGKTFVLAHRYLEIAFAEKGSLRRIAAITFTDKAAGELYEKIAFEVQKRYDVSKDEEEKKLLNTIRRQLVSANIETIHSFCIDILRQYPVEGGLDANFQPIDEITSDELIELSVEEIIREALTGNKDADDVKYLVRLAGSRSILSGQLKYLIKDRKNVFRLTEEIYNQSEEKIAAKFFNDFCTAIESIIQINFSDFLKNMTEINEVIMSSGKKKEKAVEVKRLLNELRNESYGEKKLSIIQLIKELVFTVKGNVRNDYLSRDLREGLSQQIHNLEKYINDLPPLDIPSNHKEIEQEQAVFGKSIINLFGKVVERYELKKKSNSYLDYEDILIRAKDILKNPFVKSFLSHRFKYIMVDEYQDTNEIQYKIFLPILDDLKEGNFFVVGDEKQSIYMFRDAELEVFRITNKKISDTSGENFLISLPDSFRMAPGICLFVNNLFRNLFSNPNELFNEVKHSDIVCAKQEETDSLIEIIIGKSEKKNGTEPGIEIISKTEAELVAGRIISIVNGIGISQKLKWKEIAVLVRKRKSFSSLEKIFIENHIPFNIVGGKGFYQRQPVYDIYNYFSFLLDNKNDSALVGILRSPFFTVPDSIIYEISLEKGETFWKKLIQFSKVSEKLDKSVVNLKKYIEATKTYDPVQLLRKLLSESPYLSVLAQKASGEQEVANISKLVKLTIEFQAKGFKTLYDYINFLGESIEGIEDEAQAAVTDESDSVKVMTLHQAKGLEYPAVFLYNAHEVTSSGRVKKGDVRVDKNFGLLTKIPLKDDYFGDYYSAPVNNIYDYISSKKENAELKRLFYVGATTAKNFLFISAPEEKNYKLNSFMRLLQDGLNIDFSLDEYKLEGDLQFLKIDGDNFENYSGNMNERIKIRRDLNDIAINILPPDNTDSKKELMIREIQDLPNGEFITATKFATFKQCSLKYQLSYEYGVSGMVSSYRKFLADDRNKKHNYDFSSKENSLVDEQTEEKIFPPEFRGSIIHKILQKNNPAITSEEIRQVIGAEAPSFNDPEKLKLETDIITHLQFLFNSNIYKKIIASKKFFNEYEIYLGEKDYFLHGIIDKLVIDSEKAIIVDYKTDDIQKEEIFTRADVYFPQLKFYSYIISQLFKELTTFELRLIFIKFPEEEVAEIIDRNGASESGFEISKMVSQLRLREFPQNLSHCKQCNFAVNNKICIVDWV